MSFFKKKKLLILILLSSIFLTSCTFILPNIDLSYKKNNENNTYHYQKFEHVDELIEEEDFITLNNDYEYYSEDGLDIIEKYKQLYLVSDGYQKTNSINETVNFNIASIYYSNKYDTLYVSYKQEDSDMYINSYQLYLIERHAITYFESDSSRSEDKEYLKVVLVYPNEGDYCGSNEDSNTKINGCAYYNGKFGIISLNHLSDIDEFYNKNGNKEPIRDTFAHEYGHISTYYHMVIKGDYNMENYLKKRLNYNNENYYDITYPNGLPELYTSENDNDYKIMPTEILADDFVEMFYHTDEKHNSDNYNYELEYQDYRSSLSINNYSNELIYLKENYKLLEDLKKFYRDCFYSVERINLEVFAITPILSDSTKIYYYDDVEQIKKQVNLKEIDTNKEGFLLIAVETIKIKNNEYYRVVLSPLVKKIENKNSWDKKKVYKNIVYVSKDSYKVTNDHYGIYAIDFSDENNLYFESLLTISSLSNYLLLQYFDFSYIIKTTSSESSIQSYEYLYEFSDISIKLSPTKMKLISN